MSSKLGVGQQDQMVVDFRGPEDMVHALTGAGGVRGPGKWEDPLEQEALESAQEQERGYNDLLEI